MLHWYSAGVWSTFGVPFDRLTELNWWDWEHMARVVDRQQQEAQRHERS